MKLDLDNRNVFELDMSVEAARKLLDAGIPDDLSDGLTGVFDEAQGFVFTNEGPEAFIVIKITK